MGRCTDPYGFVGVTAGYGLRYATVPLGNRDRRGDLPAERGAHPVPAAALLHSARRALRRASPRPRRGLRRQPFLQPPLVATPASSFLGNARRSGRGAPQPASAAP